MGFYFLQKFNAYPYYLQFFRADYRLNVKEDRTMKDLDKLEKELVRTQERIEAEKAKVTFTKKKDHQKKRELRDQVRYAIGGLIMDNNLCDEFSGLRDRLYDLALTRDKKKMVQQGFHSGDVLELKDQNIKECKESARKAGDSFSLTEKEWAQVKEAVDKNVYNKIYGKAGELYVYIGDNVKFYISDNVSKYLQEKEGFVT